MNKTPHNLAHIFWMGGSPCSGKSSIAELLSRRHELQYYQCDGAFAEHGRRVSALGQPTFHKLLSMTWDEIWTRPVDIQLSEEIAIYREEFDMILDDLLALPKSPPILAEGTALLPDCVNDVLVNHNQAMWIVPSESFQREHYPDRGGWVQDILRQCADPDLAFRNWMDRDVAFARWVSRRTTELGLEMIEVDGKRTIADNAQAVARHFGCS
jgi:2-phosphoglycerate kinase